MRTARVAISGAIYRYLHRGADALPATDAVLAALGAQGLCVVSKADLRCVLGNDCETGSRAWVEAVRRITGESS